MFAGSGRCTQWLGGPGPGHSAGSAAASVCPGAGGDPRQSRGGPQGSVERPGAWRFRLEEAMGGKLAVGDLSL